MRVLVLPALLSGCVTLDKMLPLYGSPFPSMTNKRVGLADNNNDNNLDAVIARAPRMHWILR